MSKVIIVKGNEKVVRAHQAEASALYAFLQQSILERGYAVHTLGPHELTTIDGVTHLLGHSQGTNVVLEQLRKNIPAELASIVLFDPSQEYRDLWNSLTLPKIAYISTLCQRPYAEGFACSIHLQDNHYFTRSFLKIQESLSKVIR